ncbi:MAG: hypothetical protein EBW52_12350, partial [Betaproteobacteria bacterium]|nr:hypothetical protein [Betaproteobacteria bacterium]
MNKRVYPDRLKAQRRLWLARAGRSLAALSSSQLMPQAFLGSGFALAGLAASRVAQAQTWPSKSIRL